MLLSTIVLTIVGLFFNSTWILLAASSVALLISLRILWLPIKTGFVNLASTQSGLWLIAALSGVVALVGLFDALEYPWIKSVVAQADWNAIGALGEVFGALGTNFDCAAGGLRSLAAVRDRKRPDHPAKYDLPSSKRSTPTFRVSLT